MPTVLTTGTDNGLGPECAGQCAARGSREIARAAVQDRPR